MAGVQRLIIGLSLIAACTTPHPQLAAGCKAIPVRRVNLFGQVRESRGDTVIIVMICGTGPQLDTLSR
jgi:hypothetical protein